MESTSCMMTPRKKITLWFTMEHGVYYVAGKSGKPEIIRKFFNTCKNSETSKKLLQQSGIIFQLIAIAKSNRWYLIFVRRRSIGCQTTQLTIFYKGVEKWTIILIFRIFKNTIFLKFYKNWSTLGYVWIKSRLY